ncbi:cytochrome cd1-nitrite reductase-like protein [Hypoxylon rubiginosum]|uniref:Cytochrome cd1-nitrite reductase-like protein n=1 Tax=Hypoxylon rubiginosum TaxID=110542 RepID=A0ACC0CSJ4_9PEZI|nr:cytochrome cd1-nitrite reductase-like protein [Hypoxylon rubiginosum]
MSRSIVSWLAVAVSVATAAAAVADPGCQTAAPQQHTINVHATQMNMTDPPFGIVYAREDIAFVGAGLKVDMINTANFRPALAREIALPESLTGPAGSGTDGAASGLALSHDKRYVYASIGPGAAIIDVEKAIAGDAKPVVGSLIGTTGVSAIQVTISPDDDYVFVTQEYGTNATRNRGTIEVFQVHRSFNGSVYGTNKGYATLGYAVVGTGLSRDGSMMYATSEVTAQSTSPNETQGTLSVLDVATLKTNPAQALLRSVDAGCSPVRLTLSPDGKHVWVTARLSNKLLAFSTAKLDSDHPNDALEASVQVGTSPVGVAIANNGRHIITADSDRFDYANATTGLTVVDTEAALRGAQGFPQIPTGLFPREFAVSPDGKTLLVSQYQSRAIQAVNLTELS